MRITYGIFQVNNDGTLSQVFMDEEFIEYADAQAYLQKNGDGEKHYSILKIHEPIT